MAEVVGRLEVRKEATQPVPRLSAPKEIACFSKGRAGATMDRAGLREFRRPESLPVDLNEGLDLFQDRDRTNPYPAPLVNILRALDAYGAVDKAEEGPSFVTFRGNIAKLLLAPYTDREEWHMEVERQGETIFFNVTEAPSCLRRQATDKLDGRKRAMQYWGFAFEEICSAGGAGLRVGIDSTEGFNSVAVSQLGQHRLVVASEVDCEMPSRGSHPTASGRAATPDMSRYVELKTSRLMETPRQVENFERHKLIKWWAQSYPAGVPRIVVGFRDDDGFAQKIQELETAKLPKYVAGKRHSWDASVCLSFLDEALTWVRQQLRAARPGERFRLEFNPAVHGRAIALA